MTFHGRYNSTWGWGRWPNPYLFICLILKISEVFLRTSTVNAILRLDLGISSCYNRFILFSAETLGIRETLEK